MATMMRGMSLREAMIRPAMSYSRGLAPRKRALCTSTTKTTPPVVSPPPRSPSTDTTEATTEEASPTGGGPSSRKRMEWRPSEVHRASATSLRRKEAEKTRPKSAGVAARVASAGGVDIRPPGLRRRELLGGVEDATPQTELASTPAIPAPVRPALQTEATTGERSVVSSSATEKFRRRRELDRLAAAGNTEAQEAMRALGSTSSSSRPDSVTSPDGKGANEGDDGDQSDRGGGGGLTPLTVLPLLLALIAAGYCAANDLLPLKWLPSSGGGGGGTSGESPGQDSTVARSEGYREYPLDEGEGFGIEGGVVERERRSLGDSLPWQRRQPSSAASPPLSKKTLSRASSSSSAPDDDAVATATVFTDAPAADGWRSGMAWLGTKATDHDTKTADHGTKSSDQGTPKRRSTSGPDGNRESEGGGRWGWWGREGSPPAGRGEGGGVSGKNSSAAVVLVGAGEGEGGGGADGKGLQQQEGAGEQQPLWLRRWRAPASSRPS